MKKSHGASALKDLLISSPFWKPRLARLAHPTAVRMAECLDPAEPLGIGIRDQAFWKGFKHAYGKKDSTIDFLIRVKKQYPRNIVLVQVGEFYESWGVDSVFLVEYAGLNRMGRRGPRAGTPLANIQAVLDGLTGAGFSVAVCEQAGDSAKTGRKERFIAEVVTPSSPVYTYGMAMDKRRGGALFPECPPEFGVVQDARGMTVVEVDPDLRTVRVFEGLTREAAGVRLRRYGGRLGRLFSHGNVDPEFFKTCGLQYETMERVSGYRPKDFPNRIEQRIKIDLSLDAKTRFLRIDSAGHEPGDAPRPVYHGTAKQIGLLPEPGVPSLVENMLPAGSPVTSGNLIRNWLLNPPPRPVADCLRRGLDALTATEASFPAFAVSNPARYVKTLHRREAGPDILKDIFKLAEDYLACYRGEFSAAMPGIHAVVSHILSIQTREGILEESARAVAGILAPILPEDEDPAHAPGHNGISAYLFELLEDEFRGRIARRAHPKIRRLYAAVEAAATRYEKTLREDFFGKGKTAAAASLDIHNRAIWLKSAAKPKGARGKKFHHPLDRYGKPVTDRWSTKAVDTRLGEYKEAVERARTGVASFLAHISGKLSDHILPIVHFATFSNLMRTLILHARECVPKGWSLDFAESGGNALELSGFFPYWMAPREAVANSLAIDGAALLTGHNMSGKSTVIRSSAAATLLASSGWLFPAKRMRTGRPIEGWFVRTGIHDDAQAGLSAFAVEMLDVKTALRDATPGSFVLIDELGKGTESVAGHAIAGSVLEYLERRGIRSLFATHWHELFSNPKMNLAGVQQICMKAEGGAPTYKIEAGSSLSSAAFETALKLGLDKELVDRAVEIAGGYRAKTGEGMASMVSDNAGSLSLDEARATLSEISGVREVRYVAAGEWPPIKDEGRSVLYVLKTSKGFYYVGETDAVLSRLETHRKEKAKKDCEALYVKIPGGKSSARELETRLIARLKSRGFPMLSHRDESHRHFGVRG